MLTKVNDVMFQYLWRHSCWFKPQKFSIVLLTCTCTPHFEKGSSTAGSSPPRQWRSVYGSQLNPTKVMFSSMCHMQHDASVRLFMTPCSQKVFIFFVLEGMTASPPVTTRLFVSFWKECTSISDGKVCKRSTRS